MDIIKLDYQRQPLPPRPPQQHPRPWRRYPEWLGYTTVHVSVIHALGYLGMVLFYTRRVSIVPQAAEVAGTFAAIIACLCIVWSGYLFYIGVVMMLDDRAAHEHLPVWCAVQWVVAVLLATACACERYSRGTNIGLAAEEANTTALVVGIASAAYAAFLICMRVGQNPLGRI